MVRGIASAALVLAAAGALAQAEAKGFVFEDANENGRRDSGEKGLDGILVSNGREIVRSGRDGSWKLPADNDVIFFAIKPKGYSTLLDSLNKPRGSYYVHKPMGSPKVRFGGVPPTGPLPSSIDFGFVKRSEPKQFKAVFFGDTQPYTMGQVEFTAQDAIAEVAARRDLAFGVSLGDVVGDNLNLLTPLMQAKAAMRTPWHYVVGNHDIDFDVPGDQDSTSSWQRLVGPPYYAFEYAGVWFVVLENVNYRGQGKGYDSALNEDQMKWLQNLLAFIPKDSMTVLMQHIPMPELKERKELFAMLSDRPNTFSIAAHWHRSRHIFFGPEEGWTGAKPHHHLVAATVCGSWWGGELDEIGIPHSTMSDGGPRGYVIGEFTESSYRLEFKPTRRPETYQMNVDAAQRVKSGQPLDIMVNFFFGSPNCKVDVRMDEGPWVTLQRQAAAKDPFYARMKALEEAKKLPATGTKLPGAADTDHIWQGTWLADGPPRAVLLEARATDMWGRFHTARRIVWVE